MHADNENRDLEYCRYYHGEQNDPYMDSFKSCAWKAEQLACGHISGSAKDFLSSVVANISNSESYDYEMDVARYIAFSESCSFEEMIEFIRECGLVETILPEKPKGRTVFESFWKGTYMPTCGGIFLYYDGRVVVKVGKDYLDEVSYYFLVGRNKNIANAVKEFVKKNWEAISALPSKRDCMEICDGSYNYYKFLSKRCGGYEYENTEDGKAIMHFYDSILNLFYRTNTPSYDWLEVTTDVETFVEKWGALLDEIDADETRAKVYAFVESERFDEDCRLLGFEMDCSDIPFNELAACSDYHVLGNAIFSQWRYYGHWAYDVRAEFDTKWFRLAFERLQELSRE